MPTGRHRQKFLTLPCFSCQVWLLVQVSCQYRYWFWSYENLLKISWKSETLPSEFCPISEGWGELGIPNLVRISLMKRVTAFIVSKLIKIKNEILADEKHAQSQQQWYFRNLFKVSNKDTRTCLKQHRSGVSLFVNFE